MRFRIEGMSCAEEVATIERELAPLIGSEGELSFDVLNGTMTVRASRELATAEAIAAAVARTGMRAEPWREDAPFSRDGRTESRNRQTILTVASGVFAFGGLVAHVWLAGGISNTLGSEGVGVTHAVPMPVRILYALGILSGAWRILPKAWLAARRLRPDMNLLMTVAVLGAVAIGEWFEAATVSFLFAVSLALEAWSVGRARRAVEALLTLSPTTARLRRADGTDEEVFPAQVPLGAVFVVKPGERVPLDGTVLAGRSGVNQAPITGESLPVTKELGDTVFAGTINGDGALEVQCTKPAGDTVLAHIVRMVGESQSRRAPSEQWVEGFARVYTPLVMVLAVLVLFIPPLLFGGTWVDWLYRALVLLVIGCPCALVISTPVSIVAALELRSEHPLAKAIVAYAREKGVALAPAEDFQIFQGKGASARIGGREYWLGSHRYLEERGQETDAVHAQLEAMAASGRTVVVVGDDHHVCGLIAIADRVRPRAAAAVQAMRDLGIKRIVMLTGDNRGTAETIARETGIDEVHAEILPADKVKAIETLVARYGAVAMLGDGVNDAPAMAQATLGIAMGAVGSDAAIEAADVALMSDDLSKVPWLIRHSRRAMAVIRENIALSLSVKAVFVALTFLGHASLWAAIAADMGASLLVIANGLRLLRAR
jgi:Cd2+/Zn2+-exporting ATPase